MEFTNSKDRKKRKTGTLELGTMMYGKVPPQAKPIEEAILGTLIQVPGTVQIVSEIISSEMFYVEAHVRIYEAILRMYARNTQVEIILLSEELRTTEELDLVGGPYALTKLTDNVTSSTNLEKYCRIVSEKFIKRELIRIAGEVIGQAYEDSTDTFELLDGIETEVANISLQHIKKDYKHISTVAKLTIEGIELRRSQDESVTGVDTGYLEMNKVIHGWQPADLIVLAARPSIGKTAFALNLARNASKGLLSGKATCVGFFSLEMSATKLVERILSADSKVWLERIKTGKMEDFQLKTLYKSISIISESPIYIDDSSSLGIFDLRSKARRMVRKHNVGLIIIDYLQLMTGDKNAGNREQQISTISGELKKLAKDLHIPIIALSQLSREMEKRPGKIKVPQLSDLRESGAIEQDADMVIFLYRPEKEEVAENVQLAGKVVVDIAKHRDGSLQTFSFDADDSIQKWTEVGTINKWAKVEAINSGSFVPVKQSDMNYTPMNSNKIKYEDPEELPF